MKLNKKQFDAIVETVSNKLFDKFRLIEQVQTYIDNILEPHYDIIDFYVKRPYIESLFYLEESKGLFKYYRDALKKIIDYSKNYVLNNQPEKSDIGQIWKFEMDENNFGNLLDNLFFNKINIKFTLFIPSFAFNNLNQYTYGSYSTSNEVIGNKLKQVNIKIQSPFTNVNNIGEYLYGGILHELLHAYQDLMRNLSNSNAEYTNYSKYADNVYNKYVEYTNESNPNVQRILGDIFYYFSESEQDAYVGNIYGELTNIGVGKLKTLSFNEILKKLSTYKMFGDIKYKVESIKRDYKNWNEKYIVDLVNGLLYNRKFDDYDKMFKWLEGRVDNMMKRIIEKIGRLIKEVIKNEQEYEINPKFKMIHLNKGDI